MGFLSNVAAGIGPTINWLMTGKTPQQSKPSTTTYPSKAAPMASSGISNDPNSPNYAPSMYAGTPEYNALNSTLGNDPVTTPYGPDPAPTQPTPTGNTAPANPNAVAPKVLPDKSGDIKIQEAGLAASDQKQSSGIAAIQDALSKLLGRYGTEATSNETNYTDQTSTNKGNLQKNKQAAMVNAAQGRQGLFGTLAALGALSGSGIDLANNAVAHGANADIAGAQDSYATNQVGLDTNIKQFREQDKQRREAAAAAAENAQTNVKNDVAAEKQKMYAQLADDYRQMENNAKADEYTQLAAALFPTIAQTAIPANTDIAYTGTSYTPSTLAQYIGGANTPQVSTVPTNGAKLPGLVVAPAAKRRDQLTA